MVSSTATFSKINKAFKSQLSSAMQSPSVKKPKSSVDKR